MKTLIPQLQARIARYAKEYEKNDKKYSDGLIQTEDYFRNRFNIDRRIIACYELHYKHIKEQEFTDSQLDMFIS
jgi:hypothetical protein